MKATVVISALMSILTSISWQLYADNVYLSSVTEFCSFQEPHQNLFRLVNNERSDTLVTSSATTRDLAQLVGYVQQSDEGRILAYQPPANIVSTKPIDLYLQQADNDYALSDSGPPHTGYVRVPNRQVPQGRQGFAFVRQLPGTLALDNYYHDGKKDSAAAVTLASKRALIAQGYRFIKTLGYVCDPTKP